MATGTVLLFSLWVTLYDEVDMLRPSPVETYKRHVTLRYILHLLSSANLFIFNPDFIKSFMISESLALCG